MPHFLQQRDWPGNSAAVWVLAAIAFCMPLAWWSVRQLRVENHFERWLPADDPDLKTQHWADATFASRDQIIISWDSSSLGDPRLDQLRKKIEPVRDAAGVPRGGLPHVQSVVDPRELLVSMQRNEVAPHEAVRRLTGVLIGAGPLRVELTEAGRSRLRRLRWELPEAIQREFGIELKVGDTSNELSSLALVPGYHTDSGDVEPSAPTVMDAEGTLQETASLEHDLSLTWPGIGMGTPQTLQIVRWLLEFRDDNSTDSAPLIERCFFVPGSPVGLAVALSDAGLADPAESVRLIRLAAIESGVPKSELLLSGRVLAGLELNRATALAAWNPAAAWTEPQERSLLLAAGLVAAAIGLLQLRSWRLSAMLLGASLCAAFFCAAIVPATGSSLDLLGLAIPILIIAITLSSGLQFVRDCKKHLLVEHTHSEAAHVTRKMLDGHVLTGIVILLALLALATAPLVPIRNFGLYAATGAVLSFLMIDYGLPALLSVAPAPLRLESLDHPGWRWLGRRLVRWPGLQFCLLSSLFAIAACGLGKWHSDSAAVRCLPNAVQDRHLEDHLAGTVSLQAIIRFDAASQEDANFLARIELVRAVEERLRLHPGITGCLSIPDFQPVFEPLEAGASMVAKSKYLKRATLVQDQIRGHEIAGTEPFYTIATAPKSLDDAGDHRLNEAGDELWRITAQVHRTSNRDYGELLRDIHNIARDVLRFQPGARHLVAGELPVLWSMQQAILRGMLRSILVAAGGILLLLMIKLRSIPAGMTALIISAAPIAAVLGVACYLRLAIDLGMAVTVPIALGLGVPGAVKFLLEFRQQIANGHSREQAVIQTLENCGPELWESAWVNGWIVSILATSQLLPLSRMGELLAAMIGASLIVQTLLLPQLLATPLGRLFTPIMPVKPVVRSKSNEPSHLAA